MESFSLSERFLKQGTLGEPKGIPDPAFALPATVNWMRALSLTSSAINDKTADTFYSSIQKRRCEDTELNSIFEQLILALHQLSALEATRHVQCKADIARVANVAWYYGIYSACSAMLIAQDGSFKDNHNQTAVGWDRQIASNNLAMRPYSMRISTILKVEAKKEIDALRAGNEFVLTTPATNLADAIGACCAYLSGTADWWRWKVEEDLRRTREFKALQVTDFRKNIARELRDSRFRDKSISFLHQAIRYRGKANYREALFLAHGKHVEVYLSTYIDDLAIVLSSFLIMAGTFVSKRIGRDIWKKFVDDIEAKRSFSLSPQKLWRQTAQ